MVIHVSCHPSPYLNGVLIPILPIANSDRTALYHDSKEDRGRRVDLVFASAPRQVDGWRALLTWVKTGQVRKTRATGCLTSWNVLPVCVVFCNSWRLVDPSGVLSV